MAQFLGEVEGQRATVHTIGSKKSGITAHVRGWNVGVKIYCEVDANGNDTIRVYETGGSNSPSNVRLLAEIKQ